MAAGAIFLVAIAAVVIQPRLLGESIAAALGGLGMVALGVIDPRRPSPRSSLSGACFLSFAGLMLISGLADTARFFDPMPAGTITVVRLIPASRSWRSQPSW